MNQLNKIKLEEDPMANSWDNDKMVLRANLADIARQLITNGCETSSEAISKVGAHFLNDRMFSQLFPLIFNIELCKMKLKDNKT